MKKDEDKDEDLQALIDRINRQALHDDFRLDEKKDIREMLESYNFCCRIFKALGAFVVGGGGLLALAQLVDKIQVWWRK